MQTSGTKISVLTWYEIEMRKNGKVKTARQSIDRGKYKTNPIDVKQMSGNAFGEFQVAPKNVSIWLTQGKKRQRFQHNHIGTVRVTRMHTIIIVRKTALKCNGAVKSDCNLVNFILIFTDQICARWFSSHVCYFVCKYFHAVILPHAVKYWTEWAYICDECHNDTALTVDIEWH